MAQEKVKFYFIFFFAIKDIKHSTIKNYLYFYLLSIIINKINSDTIWTLITSNNKKENKILLSLVVYYFFNSTLQCLSQIY